MLCENSPCTRVATFSQHWRTAMVESGDRGKPVSRKSAVNKGSGIDRNRWLEQKHMGKWEDSNELRG